MKINSDFISDVKSKLDIVDVRTPTPPVTSTSIILFSYFNIVKQFPK